MSKIISRLMKNLNEESREKGLVQIRLKGEIEFFVRDKYGRLKYYRVIKNLIVNAGLSEIIKLIGGLGGTPFRYIAIGTGTTSPSATDTALEGEVARASASVSQVTTDVDGDTLQLEATFSFSASYSITESGVFNADSDGVMLARQTFPAINVVSGDQLTVRWKIQASR